MRNRILGSIGVLWGGALVVGHLVEGGTFDFSSAYAAGKATGFVLGALMLLAGSTTLVKSFRRSDPRS
jgi:hypothetical protein